MRGVCHRWWIAWGRIGLGGVGVGLWLTIVGWRRLLLREVVCVLGVGCYHGSHGGGCHRDCGVCSDDTLWSAVGSAACTLDEAAPDDETDDDWADDEENESSNRHTDCDSYNIDCVGRRIRKVIDEQIVKQYMYRVHCDLGVSIP